MSATSLYERHFTTETSRDQTPRSWDVSEQYASSADTVVHIGAKTAQNVYDCKGPVREVSGDGGSPCLVNSVLLEEGDLGGSMSRPFSGVGFDVERMDMIEVQPNYLTFSTPTFLAGAAWERVVNSTDLLAGLRVNIVCAMRKRGSPEPAASVEHLSEEADTQP